MDERPREAMNLSRVLFGKFLLVQPMMVSFVFFVVLIATAASMSNESHSVLEESQQITLEDIWLHIIADGYLDNYALFAIIKTDKLRACLCYESGILTKRKLEYKIKAIIKQLQRKFTLAPYQVFTSASPDDLMQQYLYGFNGELLWLLSKINNRNKEEIYLEERLQSLRKLLKEHKCRYGQSKPKRNFKNVTDGKMIRLFDQFISLQEMTELLLLKMEIGFCNCAYFGNQTDCLQDIQCTFKLMMQAIGHNIQFPGIMKMDRYHPKVVPIDNWHKLKSTFLGWKRLLNEDVEKGERFYWRKVEFKQILEQIPEASFCCDAMLVTLEKIFYAFL